MNPNCRATSVARILGVALCGSALALIVVGAAAASPQAQSAGTDDAVRSTLQRYSAALASLDAAAVKKVQPSIPIETLAKAFKDMRELKVVIDEVRVLSTEASTARVSC